MKKNIDVSIIIVCYNSEDYIINCLDSISNNKSANYEIIIIDNNSIDSTIQKVKQYYNDVKLIRNIKNLGFSSAINIGIKEAVGNKIFLLNPDTKLKKNCIPNLIEKINKSSYRVIAPQILNENNTIVRSLWRFPTLISSIGELIYLDSLFKSKNYGEKNFNNSFEIESFSGAAMFFEKKIIDKIGFFNENLFWSEDIDFCKRLNQNQEKILFYPKSKLIHFGGKSSKSNQKIRITNQLLSKIKYFSLYHSSIENSILYFSMLIITTIKLFLVMPFSLINIKYRTIFFSYLLSLKLLLKKDDKVQL